MRGKCFDIGAIQAFLDGETNAAETAAIAAHASGCDECAAMIADAEEENSFVFSALDREMNTLVPTQRLWTRINRSIETERSETSVWQKLFAGISASLQKPSFAAAAGVIVFSGFLAFVWMNGGVADVDLRADVKSRPTSSGPVSTGTNGTAVPNVIAAQEENKSRPATDDLDEGDNVEPRSIRVRETDRRRTRIRPMRASHRMPVNTRGGNLAGEPVMQYLPGEESYVRTIENLKRTVDENDRGLPMSASSRVAFERDMAVVDDAIAKMRDVVKKDPENQGAKQVLYSSYQNKIDLLNSVARRDELMASIR